MYFTDVRAYQTSGYFSFGKRSEESITILVRYVTAITGTRNRFSCIKFKIFPDRLGRPSRFTHMRSKKLFVYLEKSRTIFLLLSLIREVLARHKRRFRINSLSGAKYKLPEEGIGMFFRHLGGPILRTVGEDDSRARSGRGPGCRVAGASYWKSFDADGGIGSDVTWQRPSS